MGRRRAPRRPSRPRGGGGGAASVYEEGALGRLSSTAMRVALWSVQARRPRFFSWRSGGTGAGRAAASVSLVGTSAACVRQKVLATHCACRRACRPDSVWITQWAAQALCMPRARHDAARRAARAAAPRCQQGRRRRPACAAGRRGGRQQWLLPPRRGDRHGAAAALPARAAAADAARRCSPQRCGGEGGGGYRGRAPAPPRRRYRRDAADDPRSPVTGAHSAGAGPRSRPGPHAMGRFFFF